MEGHGIMREVIGEHAETWKEMRDRRSGIDRDHIAGGKRQVAQD